MAERSRRGASRQAAAKSSLAELLAVKRSGKKRAELYEVEKEESLFDTVDEREYGELVKKRRAEGGDFIVDDAGLGYVDLGEEEDWTKVQDEKEAEEEGEKQASPTAKKKDDRKGKKAAEANPHEARRLHGMFAAAARAGASGSVIPKLPKKDTANSDKLLEDILGGLDADESDALAMATAAPVPFAAVAPVASHPVFARGVPRASAPAPAEPAAVADYMVEEMKEEPAPLAEPEEAEMVEVTPAPEPESASKRARRVSFSNLPPLSPDSAKRKASVALEEEAEVAAVAVPVAAAAVTEAKPTLLAPAAPKAETGPSDWDVLCAADDNTAPTVAPSMMDPAAAVAAGVPLDEEGNLPFYFLDAYEDTVASPGKVFLFGKVPLGSSQFQSACCVVNDLQRCVYAVPREGTFADSSGELAMLEEAAKSGGKDARIALLKKLQAMACEVKDELRNLLLDRNISSFTMVPVKRAYAFEREDVPHTAQYVIKLRIPATMAPLPSDISGRHFTCLFGTQTSPLEALMLKRKIMGPSWLSIQRPQTVGAQLSWCKTEVAIFGHKAISVLPQQREPPPVSVIALNLKTVVNQRDKCNEIVAASVLYCKDVRVDGPMSEKEWSTPANMNHFTVVRKLDGSVFPPGWDDAVRAANNRPVAKRNGGVILSTQSSERALLSFLLARLHQLDADVLVGHNIGGFGLDVLLHRLKACKVPNWSRVGRLRRNKLPNLVGGGNQYGGGVSNGALSTLAGRLLCDTYLAAREFVREVSYTLGNLAQTQLKKTRSEFDNGAIPGMFGTSESLLGLVQATEYDAWLSLALMFHLSVLPLTRQLTCLSGSVWNKTLQGARAQRIEYLLLHEFHARKFLLPDKLSFKEKQRLAQKEDDMADMAEAAEGGMEGAKGGKAKGPSYAGGLVLEPKKGLYDKFVLLLDFNSLYPSIIQEYNICFTTVARPKDDSIPALPENVKDTAVLPAVLRKLVSRRRQVKEMLKTERDITIKQQLDIRQQALKLTANSMYGCLGFANSRFFAKPLAQLVTAQGREILQSTADLVDNNLGLEVIYGDTDSIMINTNLLDIHKARQIGGLIKKEVNKKYRLLELELDYIFKTILLLKKKKYAALKIDKIEDDGRYTTSMECKGLDIVRRDWSPLSKDLGQNCLKAILSGNPAEEVVESIHALLRETKERIEGSKVPLEALVITKQLTKRPQDYPDASSQPHVQVALRRLKAGKSEGVAAGETVPYVICVTTNSDVPPATGGKGIAARAYHPEEISEHIQPDWQYYLAQQVHPVVSRLCAPMEGTSAGQIADCLGLDAAKFHSQTARDSASAREDALLGGGASLDDEDRYKLCMPLLLQCPQCADRFSFKGVTHLLSSHSSMDPLVCPKCNGGAASVDAEAMMTTPRKPSEVVAAPCLLTGPMLANQVRLRLNEFVAAYYDGWVRCDEACECATRSVCTKTVGDAAPGTLSTNAACAGRMGRAFTEADLYKQLSHFVRLLDEDAAINKLPTENQEAGRELLKRYSHALLQGKEAAERLCDRAAYKWVRLDLICSAA